MPGRIIRAFSDRMLAPVSGWKVVHWLATVVMLWLGFLFCLPGNTFELSPAYYYFLQAGSEGEWAVVFLLVGLGGIIGGVTASLNLKLFAGMILSIAHGVVAVMFLAGSPLSTGSGTYAAIAVAATMRFWRLVKVRTHDG